MILIIENLADFLADMFLMFEGSLAGHESMFFVKIVQLHSLCSVRIIDAMVSLKSMLTCQSCKIAGLKEGDSSKFAEDLIFSKSTSLQT